MMEFFGTTLEWCGFLSAINVWQVFGMVFAMCPVLRASTVSYAGVAHFSKHSLEYPLNFWSQSKKNQYVASGTPLFGQIQGGKRGERKNQGMGVPGAPPHGSQCPTSLQGGLSETHTQTPPSHNGQKG